MHSLHDIAPLEIGIADTPPVSINGPPCLPCHARARARCSAARPVPKQATPVTSMTHAPMPHASLTRNVKQSHLAKAWLSELRT